MTRTEIPIDPDLFRDLMTEQAAVHERIDALVMTVATTLVVGAFVVGVLVWTYRGTRP